MKNKFRISLIPMIALISSSLLLSLTYFQGKNWVVPDASKKMKNPVAATADNLKSGKALYAKNCKSCHGTTGKGDGTKSKDLNTPCGDFADKGFQAQTDGAIFYKIKEGREDMPSFKKSITEDNDIWTLVNYVRTFGVGTKPVEDPKKPADDPKKPADDPKKPADDPKKPNDKPVVGKKDSAMVVIDTTSAPEKTQIEQVLKQYEKALNSSDTVAIAALYTSDGVYIPANGATAIGTAQIKASYKQLFNSSTMNEKYSLEEIRQVGDIAIIRATFKGERTFLGFNQKMSEENRELILLKKVNGNWKIYRCMSN
ncbi:MAG: SgcJ/EcaC family oxidoreductase [Bacteroidetes bacterium]|nr:SgcJ/EcaC family oxidoreductase [Bacteroidota bacterium]